MEARRAPASPVRTLRLEPLNREQWTRAHLAPRLEAAGTEWEAAAFPQLEVRTLSLRRPFLHRVPAAVEAAVAQEGL